MNNINGKRSYPMRRALAYIIRALIVVAGIVLFCWICFTEAKNVTSLVVVTTEGMTLRADNIVNVGNPDKYAPELLPEYFASGFNDALAQKEDYLDYTILNYDYSVKISKIYVMPWSQTATLEVQEIMSRIEGRVSDAFIDSDDAISKTPPQWDTQKYRVTLSKTDGRWFISKLTPIDSNVS